MCAYLATESDIKMLEKLYAGTKAYHGELHDHAATGGRSDGKRTLDEWKAGMAELGMDFATIVDHKQVRHMYLDEWDDTMFIGGTEAASWFPDMDLEKTMIHYNMVFADREAALAFLRSVPEFNFEGTGLDGMFPRYPKFTRQRFTEIVEAIRAAGGFMASVHPKSDGMMTSDDPLDYWFADETGLEVIYTYKSDRDGEDTAKNYKLWTDLLALGKRVWATSGNDEHNMPSDKGLSTIYADRKHAQAFVDRLREGDLTAGPLGIRMAVGDTVTGGKTEFAGKRLVIAVGDFHKSVRNPEHEYRVDVYNEDGLVFSREISCEDMNYFAMDTRDCRFYRAEVLDVTLNSRLAVGNPIWNTR